MEIFQFRLVIESCIAEFQIRLQKKLYFKKDWIRDKKKEKKPLLERQTQI